MNFGCSRGNVTCLKLSPNLRKVHINSQQQAAGQLARSESVADKQQVDEEAARLDRVLNVARKNVAQLEDWDESR